MIMTSYESAMDVSSQYIHYKKSNRRVNFQLILILFLPKSVRDSTEDAAEIISGLIQTGHIALTSVSLINLLKSVKDNEPYKMRIKEVLDAPAWMTTKATTALVTLFGNSVEPDSPKPP